MEPIESSDGHESCVICLVRALAEAALEGSDCPHCGDMSLRTLTLRVAIVQGDELAQIALPCSSSAASFEPSRKVPQVSDADLSRSGDEPAPTQCPCAPNTLLQVPFQCASWPLISAPPLTLKMWCVFRCHGGHWRGRWCNFGGSVCERGVVQQPAGLHCAPWQRRGGPASQWCRASKRPVQGSGWARFWVGAYCRAGQKPSVRVVPPVGSWPKRRPPETQPLLPRDAWWDKEVVEHASHKSGA